MELDTRGLSQYSQVATAEKLIGSDAKKVYQQQKMTYYLANTPSLQVPITITGFLDSHRVICGTGWNTSLSPN